MKRMTRVINEDRKTGRRRRSSEERDLDFVLGALTLEMFDCEKTRCVTGKEREKEREQLMASSHVSRVKYQIIAEIFFPCHFLNMPLENATPSLVDYVSRTASLKSIIILSILIFRQNIILKIYHNRIAFNFLKYY